MPVPPTARGVVRAHRGFAILAVLSTFGAASHAAAQDTPLFSLGGGLSFASGTVSDTHDSGFNFGALAAFPVAGRLDVEVSATYARLGGIREVQLEALDINPESFEAGGGFLEGGYRWTGALLAGGRLLLMPRHGRVVPSLHALAGVASTGISDQRTLFLGDRDMVDGFSERVLAAALGAGVEVHIRNGVGVFGAVRYLTAFTDPARTTMIPVSFGMSLRLEER